MEGEALNCRRKKGVSHSYLRRGAGGGLIAEGLATHSTLNFWKPQINQHSVSRVVSWISVVLSTSPYVPLLCKVVHSANKHNSLLLNSVLAWKL